MVDVILSVAAMPTGAVQLDPPGKFGGADFSLCPHNDPAGECRVAYPMPEGTSQSVKLTAVPDPNSNPRQSFLRWSIPECGTEPTCTIVLTTGVEPPEIYALFTPPQLRVIIEGSGQVKGANGTIDCTGPAAPLQPPPPGCVESTLPAGTPLTLTAEPVSGTPVTWVYGCDPGDDPHALTCALVPENRMVGVRFGDGSGPGQPFNVGVNLRVTKSGSGTGTVTGGPTGSGGGKIECGSTCIANPPVGFGVRVKLTAEASSGSHFVRWVGAPCGTQSACILNAGPVTTVGAVFDATPPAPLPPPPPPQPPPTAPPPPLTTTTPTERLKLEGRLLGLTSRRVAGRYRVFARIEVTKLVDARLKVTRAARVLGQRAVPIRKARATAWVALARSTRPGPCVMLIQLRDRDGQVVIIRRRIVLGR
jgi:hypothetical protein